MSEVRDGTTVWLVALVLVCFTACRQNVSPSSSPSLRLGADRATARLTARLAENYERASPEMAISLEQNTPKSLLQALYNGHVDAITLLGDVPRRAEFRTVLGYSALAVVSYPAQLNLGLSSSQLRAIYSGRITDWAAVGGERGAIDVIAWTPDSSERLAFDSAVLGGSRVTSNAQLVADSNQVVRLIQADKQAVGYLPASEIQPGLRTLEIDGISISSRDPRYLLIVPIILVSSGEPDGNLRKFLDWALRSESQQNMTQFGTP